MGWGVTHPGKHLFLFLFLASHLQIPKSRPGPLAPAPAAAALLLSLRRPRGEVVGRRGRPPADCQVHLWVGGGVIVWCLGEWWWLIGWLIFDCQLHLWVGGGVVFGGGGCVVKGCGWF